MLKRLAQMMGAKADGEASPPVALSGVAYHIEEIAPIERIPALAADAKILTAFKDAGHVSYAHSEPNVTLAELAIRSARKSLASARLEAKDIDAIVVGTSEIREPKRYPEMLSTDILTALGVSNVPLVGVTLAGCANWSSALRVARNLLVAERLRNVLVIEADQVRGAMQRQIFEDEVASVIFGDGAASVVVTGAARDGPGDFELVSMSQTIRPLDWKGADINLIAANNVLGFNHVLNEAMARARVTRADFTRVFLSNIAVGIVAQLAELLGLDMKSVYTANCSRTAHVWSCDNLINLADSCAAENVPRGALFLMVCQAESFFSAIVCRKR